MRVLPLETIGEKETALIISNRNLCLSKIDNTDIFGIKSVKFKKMMKELIDKSKKDK
jgi:hypothetical protein